MAVKAVLFDLDNTLINFLAFKKETAKAAAKAMVDNGLPATEIQAYGKIFSIYDEKGIEYQKTFHDVVEPFGLEVNKAERIQQSAILAYLNKKFDVLKPYPMVKPILKRLRKNHRLGIITDAPRNKTWQRLVLTELADEFDMIVTKDDTLSIKPSSTPFQLALQKLGLLAPACLFVGDDPDRDIKGAKEVGMHTCLAKYGLWNKSGKTNPDFSISSFKELVSLLDAEL